MTPSTCSIIAANPFFDHVLETLFDHFSDLARVDAINTAVVEINTAVIETKTAVVETKSAVDETKTAVDETNTAVDGECLLFSVIIS